MVARRPTKKRPSARPAAPAVAPTAPPRTETQRRLLDAALDLFAERGFDGTSTVEIAARAGVAEKTLFANFGSKERLYQAALGPASLRVIFIPEALRSLGTVLEHPPAEPRALLRGILENRVRFALAHPREVRLLAQHMVLRPESMQAIIDGFEAHIAPVILPLLDGMMRAGALRRDLPAPSVIRMVASLAVGYVLTRVVFRPDLPWDDAREIDAMVEVLASGLTGPPPRRRKSRSIR